MTRFVCLTSPYHNKGKIWFNVDNIVSVAEEDGDTMIYTVRDIRGVPSGTRVVEPPETVVRLISNICNEHPDRVILDNPALSDDLFQNHLCEPEET